MQFTLPALGPDPDLPNPSRSWQEGCFWRPHRSLSTAFPPPVRARTWPIRHRCQIKPGRATSASGGTRASMPAKVSRLRTCRRIFLISCGSSIQAITRSLPPHSGQVSISIVNTRLRRYIHVMRAGGLLVSKGLLLRNGFNLAGCLQFGAITSCNEASQECSAAKKCESFA